MAGIYESVFSSALGQAVLVFVLVFTLVFAVLQKSEVLGKKKQIDALISLAIALMVISVGYAMDIITKMAPFLSVGLVIILTFLLLTGIFYKGAMDFPNKLKAVFGALAFIAVVVAVIVFSGSWEAISSFFSGNSSLVGNIILIAIVAAAIWIAVSLGGEESGGKSN